MSRVYAPLDPTALESLRAGDQFVPAAAFTVTTRLRSAIDGLDEEELEHIATQLAAVASRITPKVVVALEVAPARITDISDELASCEISNGISMKDVVCFFIADSEVSDDADLEMSWYDVTEADVVAQELAL